MSIKRHDKFMNNPLNKKKLGNNEYNMIVGFIYFHVTCTCTFVDNVMLTSTVPHIVSQMRVSETGTCNTSYKQIQLKKKCLTIVYL